ncbi:GNAT family N-acetyltransferase [Fontivita pretiosa]|uniref:GNAT family N-acetyltransferase n=1 Tax=Fontivita pretiosa TaxID=2989684 RepID=UPI003D16633A
MSDAPRPVLLDLPQQLETPRLILRAPCPGDGAIVFPAVRDSLNELLRWMIWARPDYSQNDAEEWCRRSAAQWLTREQLQFVILARPDRRYLGSIGAFKLDWKVPSGEIGYWLRTDQTGHGYMTEAVCALTQLLHESLGFVRVQICMDDRNQRSWRVAERCGFGLEGIHRCDQRRPDGVLRDTRVYAKVWNDPEA